jgi:hypothetical protein
MSNPKLVYTPANASYSTPEDVLSTRDRGTITRAGDGDAGSANNPGDPGGATITAFAAIGVSPRSRTPCRSSASRRRACSISRPSSTSSRAEPT